MATTTAFVAGAFLWRESEFVSGLTGACGPNALAMAASWARQSRVSTLSVYQAMHAHSLCDSNGVSTIGSLHAAAPLIGLTVASYRAYGEPWPQWQAWMLAQLSADRAIVIEVANGQALQDALTGQGENASNLRYHFFTIVGHVNGYYVCLDGDNLSGGNYRSNGFQAANVAQHYTDAVMSAARPCAAIAIAGKAKPLIDETHLGAGVRDFLATHPQPASYETLLAERPMPGATDGSTISVFGDTSSDRVAFWDGTHQCVRLGEWDGHIITRLLDDLSAANAEVSALRQQLATAQAALAKAEAAPATDPAAAKALDLVKAMRAALAV